MHVEEARATATWTALFRRTGYIRYFGAVALARAAGRRSNVGSLTISPIRCWGTATYIELQEAILTSQVTTIEARATLGAVTILVPDGVDVRLSGKSILGAKSSEVTRAPLPGAPVIEVIATAILGNVTVRPANLTQRIVEGVRGSSPEGIRPR
jgi:Cell wall-active antibiotics response 4TMS YvqF